MRHNWLTGPRILFFLSFKIVNNVDLNWKSWKMHILYCIQYYRSPHLKFSLVKKIFPPSLFLTRAREHTHEHQEDRLFTFHLSLESKCIIFKCIFHPFLVVLFFHFKKTILVKVAGMQLLQILSRIKIMQVLFPWRIRCVSVAHRLPLVPYWPWTKKNWRINTLYIKSLAYG